MMQQIENGLVEAVAVLISKMPRLRPESAVGKLGECFKSKPEFSKVYPDFYIFHDLLWHYIYRATCDILYSDIIGLGEMEGTNHKT